MEHNMHNKLQCQHFLLANLPFQNKNKAAKEQF